MRRTLAPLVVALAAAGFSGCAGAEGEQAQELLLQSEQAVANVESFRFAARFWTSGADESLTMVMRGGGYSKGKRAGDFLVQTSVQGVPGFSNFTMVSRKGALSMNAGGGWVPVPADAATAQQNAALGGFDFLPFIKDVDVEEGKLVGGEPMTKITGIINTEGLVDGVLGQLGGVSELSGLGAFGAAFEDTRVVIYLSDVTHLPVRGLLDIPVKVLDERVTMHLDYALLGVNEPVKIPNPA
jgi:hypothetical protein